MGKYRRNAFLCSTRWLCCITQLTCPNATLLHGCQRPQLLSFFVAQSDHRIRKRIQSLNRPSQPCRLINCMHFYSPNSRKCLNLDSQQVDIWSLPARDRIHATIGQEIQKSIFSSNPGGRNTSGLSLFYTQGTSCTCFLTFIFQGL